MKALLTGGVKSGKSAYAEQKAAELGSMVHVIVTAEARDNEMVKRIELHQSTRPSHWIVHEEPILLGQTIEKLGKSSDPIVVIVDCLTIWVSNLMHQGNLAHQVEHQQSLSCALFDQQTACFLSMLNCFSDRHNLLLVTNEVGSGIMPISPLARAYSDRLGVLNLTVAQSCEEVVFLVSGIPWRLKNAQK